jgi:hypothetical protein
MADVKHCTASPINDFEGFLHIFYCWLKNFTESLTEKLLRQVGWQGRVQNNRNSPHDVRSSDCRVLTQMYSPNLFSSLAFGELASGGFFHCHECSRIWKLFVNFTLIQCIKIVSIFFGLRYIGDDFFRVESSLIQSNSFLTRSQKLTSVQNFFSCQYVRRDLIKFENSNISRTS